MFIAQILFHRFSFCKRLTIALNYALFNGETKEILVKALIKCGRGNIATSITNWSKSEI